jgi:multidrug transporter EmrE-like cation transporter
VLIIGDIIFAASGLLPYSLYSQTAFSNSVSLINAITLLLFSLGLPALQIKQFSQTRWSGLSGVTILCTSSLLFAIFDFIVTNPYLTSYPYPLAYAVYGTQVIGNVLLGIAIMRASAFPHWTGMFLIVSGIFYIGGFFSTSLPDTPYYILNNIASLSGCIAFIRCGYTLLQSKGNAPTLASSSP